VRERKPNGSRKKNDGREIAWKENEESSEKTKRKRKGDREIRRVVRMRGKVRMCGSEDGLLDGRRSEGGFSEEGVELKGKKGRRRQEVSDWVREKRVERREERRWWKWTHDLLVESFGSWNHGEDCKERRKKSDQQIETKPSLLPLSLPFLQPPKETQ